MHLSNWLNMSIFFYWEPPDVGELSKNYETKQRYQFLLTKINVYPPSLQLVLHQFQ